MYVFAMQTLFIEKKPLTGIRPIQASCFVLLEPFCAH
jgi:hypothetical protein